jgi:hypothetical protein
LLSLTQRISADSSKKEAIPEQVAWCKREPLQRGQHITGSKYSYHRQNKWNPLFILQHHVLWNSSQLHPSMSFSIQHPLSSCHLIHITYAAEKVSVTIWLPGLATELTARNWKAGWE